jgi:peptidyl-prolyl cis-trans isomerase SurA
MLRLTLTFVVAASLASAVVIDRIAVIAGKRLIKASDIDRDLRVTAFLNREPLVFTPDAKRKAAERLVDQSIIREEIASGGFSAAQYGEATAMQESLRRDRYQNSVPRFREALTQYGLTEPELHDQLRWQLTVLRFIDERFRPGILVSDEDVRKYYDDHLADLRRQYPNGSGFDALATQIRSSLEGEKINEEFEAWLQEARRRDHVEYKLGAFE